MFFCRMVLRFLVYWSTGLLRFLCFPQQERKQGTKWKSSCTYIIRRQARRRHSPTGTHTGMRREQAQGTNGHDSGSEAKGAVEDPCEDTKLQYVGPEDFLGLW